MAHTIQAKRRFAMHPLTEGIRMWIVRARQHLKDANDARNMELLHDGIVIAHAKELKRLQDEEALVAVGDLEGIETKEVLSGVYI